MGLYAGLRVGSLSFLISVVVTAISGISGDAITNVGYGFHNILCMFNRHVVALIGDWWSLVSCSERGLGTRLVEFQSVCLSEAES